MIPFLCTKFCLRSYSRIFWIGSLRVQKDVGKFEFLLPPTIAEQKAIAEALSEMDADIAALENKLTKYRQVKQGMMQQLLTGKIRIL